MTIKLDQKDKKLIYELDIDSRQSASQLARTIGISKQGSTFKINNLVSKEVIQGFPAILNTALIGYLSFRIYFKLIDILPEEENEFRNYLINHELVPWVVGCQGLWDYIIVVFPKDFIAFQKFSTELNNKYGKFIEKKDIALVTVAHHFRSGYILGKKKDISPLTYAGQPKEIIQLDEIEKKILKKLANNSRTPIIEIAKAVKTSSKNVAYRIEKLRKQEIIEGYSLCIDYEKVGFERYKLFIKTKNMTEQKEKFFIQYSRMHPYILYYSKSIGENDVEIELIVKNSVHLREIIAQIRNKFSDVIKSFETMKIYKEYKLNFYPWNCDIKI